MIYHRSIFSHGYIWLTRFRYRRGHGIQSPSAFQFVNTVIHETTPYYSYEWLSGLYKQARSRHRKHLLPKRRYELIFRLANYCMADEIIEAGTHTGMGITYASAARKEATCYILNKDTSSLHNSQLPPAVLKKGSVADLLQETLCAYSGKNRMVIFNCELFSPEESMHSFSILTEHLRPGDCVMISGLQCSKALRNSWKEHGCRTGISFDLYEAGILLVEHSLHTKCYLINY